YPAYSLSVPNRAIKKINQVNFDKIWKKKTHYIRRVEMIKDFKDGGLQAIDFDFIHGTLKINWLKGFLNNNNLWYHLPREIFNKVGGTELLLKCDFTIQKLPIKLSSFHQQVLLYWKLLYNHNFTPHNTPIWNNRYITVKNKSLYNKNWMEKEIWSVIHLVDRSGDLLSYNNFCLKYNLVCNRSEFKSITKAIPKSILNLIKGILTNPTPICPHLPQLLIGGCDFNEIKIPNKTIRNNFNYISYPSLSFRNSVSQFYGKDTITMLQTKYLNFPITPKAKELHFKTLNGVYPSSDFLRQRFGFETNNCIFCDECETTDHFFFECIHSKTLWQDIHDWLHPNIFDLHDFTKENIIFGLSVINKKDEFLINNIVILGKFYIHKSKYMKVKPRFCVFHNEFLLYTKALKLITKKNALQLLNIIEEYHLKEKP
ncbi:hypothetical protein LDENG_00235560, partial [Lucifuga dentata]